MQDLVHQQCGAFDPLRTASTGAFGYPMEPAADIAFETIAGALLGLSSVKHIRFVLYGSSDLAIHERMLKAMDNG